MKVRAVRLFTKIYITKDSKRDLFIGNHAGGLAFFNSNNIYGVGINELANTIDISVSPNPCTDYLQIHINDNSITKHQIQLIDVLGKEVYSDETFNKSIYINTLNFTKGIYFLRIKSETNSSSITKRIIVM